MEDEVSAAKLKKVIGKRVQILAFGILYEGILKKVDARSGLVRVEDEKDYVLLEIERIDHFRILQR